LQLQMKFFYSFGYTDYGKSIYRFFCDTVKYCVDKEFVMIPVDEWTPENMSKSMAKALQHYGCWNVT